MNKKARRIFMTVICVLLAVVLLASLVIPYIV